MLSGNWIARMPANSSVVTITGSTTVWSTPPSRVTRRTAASPTTVRRYASSRRLELTRAFPLGLVDREAQVGGVPAGPIGAGQPLAAPQEAGADHVQGREVEQQSAGHPDRDVELRHRMAGGVIGARRRVRLDRQADVEHRRGPNAHV